ncbi:MAG: peptidyl-prolyl cis-trans isomerase [Campylobacterota bacterium]|nr:peptidyl-prolyl cis-trans isomerase [Campylobacterota bacterium]
MITWMQRHKKYLIVTIWISTIAFVGAGFVGWGQYSYGDKAGAIAKVGEVEITVGDLQKSYSNLYAQYNQMFQGSFDEEKAKSFGLKAQAMQFLTQQALILNLAASYDLEVNDEEIVQDLQSKDYFFKNGSFDKNTYKDVLSQNNLSVKDYEESLKKELLIKKTLALLQVSANENELKIADTVLNIADKLEYKILTPQMISVDVSDEMLKAYWEKSKQNFMSEVAYELKYIKQGKISKEPTQEELTTHYNENRENFKDPEGKILEFETAKAKVIEDIISKESKKEALKSYIAYKKGETAGMDIKNITISQSNNPFNADVLEIISKLSKESAFSKPILVGDDYYTFELVTIIPAHEKSFEDAKAEALPLYVAEQKREKLSMLAKNSFATFSGNVTDFITATDYNALTELNNNQANEFLSTLFTSKDKNGYITLEDESIVMYKILEQKLLNKTNTDQNNPIVKIKGNLFNEGLIKNLQNRYKTEIFMEGL